MVKDLSDRWDAYAKRTDVLPLDGRPWGQRVPADLASLNAAAAAGTLPTGSGFPSSALLPQRPEKPNVIVILCDDLGYGDLGCFGSSNNIDRMAEEGAVLTSFYSTSGVCTPSRSSVLTGCYPRRVSMHMNHMPPGSSTMRQVLFPVARKGLHPNEITIAEALKKRGYATACVGKWHLGDQKVFLPTRQGFDEYFGIPYSNDMGSKQFPINPLLPLLRNEEVIEAPVDQTTLTRRYSEEAISFIRKHQEDPFFLYLPHTMPHNPVHVSEEFKGQSENGLYADCVEEIDWSTGQILSTLQELNLSERTLIIFTSDNGAAMKWGGSNTPLSGYKGSVMEGGRRMPCVAHWPGQIPAGHRSLELTSTLDLFPTLVALTGGEMPTDRRQRHL
ncbi:MAG: arylsulfatase A [Verrucomicrobiales bacterium]